MKPARTYMRRWAAALTVTVATCAIAWAQQPPNSGNTGPTPNLPPSPNPRIVSPQAPRGAETAPRPAPADPTVPGPEIRHLLDCTKTTTGAVAPARPAGGLPAMRIKARVLARDKPGMALVEIGDRLVMVQPGAEVNVALVGGEGQMKLKVVEVGAAGVKMEVENRDQPISLY